MISVKSGFTFRPSRSARDSQEKRTISEEGFAKLARVHLSCNGMNMSSKSKTSGSEILLRTLAGFRFELRQFLHISELAAVEAGLQPQQHQLLLQVAGAPDVQPPPPTLGPASFTRSNFCHCAGWRYRVS
jgi:hypothetical protein